MPIATPEIYAQMLDRAKEQGFAYPAINVTSSQTLNAALRGFAEANSDGIIQVSTGGAEYLSGSIKEMVTGAAALPEYARVEAAKYPVHIALHTDHCPKDKLDGLMRPLLAISRERVAKGQQPLFQSHMWDGSAVPLAENLRIASDQASFCLPQMQMGIVPDAGGTSRLAKVVGPTLAKDMVLSCRVIDADEALRSGLVSRVVSHDALGAELDGLAARVGTLPWPAAYFATVAIDVGPQLDPRRAADIEGIADQVMLRHDEVLSRVESFQETKGLKGLQGRRT